jgi:hypothetical protein
VIVPAGAEPVRLPGFGYRIYRLPAP